MESGLVERGMGFVGGDEPAGTFRFKQKEEIGAFLFHKGWWPQIAIFFNIQKALLGSESAFPRN